MTHCIFFGTGDAAEAVLLEMNRTGRPYVVLCEDPSWLRRCSPLPGSRPIRGFSEADLIPTLRGAGVDVVSFVGNYPELRLITKDSAETIDRMQGTLRPPAVLNHLVDSLRSVGVAFRSIAEEFEEFRPKAEYRCSPLHPDTLSEFYKRALDALSGESQQAGQGWASACLIGSGGFVRLPKELQNTAELIEEFVLNRPSNCGDVFLCRHSPWKHACVRRRDVEESTFSRALKCV